MDSYEQTGYDVISGCSYNVVVLPFEDYSDDRNPRTISLEISYKFVNTRTDHHYRNSSFTLNRYSGTSQISSVDHVTTWLNGSPTFPLAVGTVTAELITRILGDEYPTTSSAIVVVRVEKDGDIEKRRARAIARIKKVVIMDSGFESCVICLEEFKVGYEVDRLPCDHVFHGDCIAKWFHKQLACPLCRFELSVDEVIVDTSV